MGTIKDVAKMAGVSTATVSKILNHSNYSTAETRQKVMSAIEHLNYKPNHAARSMVKHQTGMIALIIPDVRNPFFTDVARGLEDVANKYDYRVMLCDTDENPEKQWNYIEALQGKIVDGFVIAVSSDSDRQLRKIDSDKLPFVLIDRGCGDMKADKVIVDNRDGAYKAIRHLIDCGHRRIGFIAGKHDTQTSRERYQGYQQALNESGIELDIRLIQDGKFTIEGGYQAAKTLFSMKEQKISALFSSNNAMTIGVMKALNENKLRIPDDIALISFDDADWAEFLIPPLTVVRQPTYTMGTLAGEILFQRIEGQQSLEQKEIILKPELIIRSSCGSIKPLTK